MAHTFKSRRPGPLLAPLFGLAALLLAACGQSGNLYLPDQEPAKDSALKKEQRKAQTPPPAAAAAAPESAQPVQPAPTPPPPGPDPNPAP